MSVWCSARISLGPLLLLLYINDIYNSSDKLSISLFADDTNLLHDDKTLRSLSLEVIVLTMISK